MGKRPLHACAFAALLACALMLGACGNAGEPAEPSEPLGGSAAVCPEDGIDLDAIDIPAVSVEEAALMMEIDARLVILDVRTPAEFAEGHLPGAVNIDYQGADFAGEVAKLDREGHYLVYCRSGVRASYAVAIMLSQGFAHLDNMTGGYLEWTAQGRPTATD